MECGECTLCCKLANISDMDAIHGEYCKKCMINNGCSIYKNRPEPCKTFQCMYYQMENAGEELRPDKCNVIFEKINDNLILATIDGKIIDVNKFVTGQIDFFNREGFSVMLQQFNPHKHTCFMDKNANKNEIIKALEDKANGSS